MNQEQVPERGAAIWVGRQLRNPLNSLIARSSRVPTTPFIEPNLFPWAEALEAGWSDIRAELDSLRDRGGEVLPLDRISPDHAGVALDGKWKSFVFEAYGYHVPRNRALCPRTSELLDQVPGLMLAMFSIMEPGTYVPLHTGVSKALINAHLGLDVPPGDCRIEVGGETRWWNPGKLLLLDDTYPHQVWNNTDRTRVVLLMQIRRPVGRLGRFVGGAFLAAVRRSGYVQDPRRALGGVPNS
ncbi:MAG TPA: aspartyl/asparaginyl beta-hydroxylase domain-containing protein [Sphingomicrobium sp.]|nr:aspartyl/asparaginyl beta-hydroxylase domain-containing protein [Sphingomicrobium sp.]